MANQQFQLSGKVALITGGGTGLGKSFSRDLAAAGATVILCARRVDKLQETCAEINASGGNAYAVAMDVTNAQSVEEAFEQASEYGVIDIVVNNAGVVATEPLHLMSEEVWDGVLNTNLKGAWLVAKAAASRLIEQQHSGSIINIASILGTAVQKGTGPYGASKAGLIHLTKIMAAELAKYNIRVNSLAPGYVSTELADDFLDSAIGQALTKKIPQRRLGSPEEMSAMLLMLASDASAYTTGANFIVDGGLSLSPL